MKIRCENCAHEETINAHFFVKALGVAVSGYGLWAWVTFLAAGTGFALPICIAIVLGGASIAAFSNEIVAWVSEHFDCPNCGLRQWEAIIDD